MAGINITSVNRQVKDISQDIYATKLQRDEMQTKSVNKDESSGLQNAVAEKLSDKSKIKFDEYRMRLTEIESDHFHSESYTENFNKIIKSSKEDLAKALNIQQNL